MFEWRHDIVGFKVAYEIAVPHIRGDFTTDLSALDNVRFGRRERSCREHYNTTAIPKRLPSVGRRDWVPLEHGPARGDADEERQENHLGFHGLADLGCGGAKQVLSFTPSSGPSQGGCAVTLGHFRDAGLDGAGVAPYHAASPCTMLVIHGRLAQRESTRFTREGSLVQSSTAHHPTVLFR